MKTRPLQLTAIATFFCLLPYFTSAQETIEIRYNADDNSLGLAKLPKKVKHNTTYTLVLKQINSAHVAPFTAVTTSRFVSDIPAILRSIYVGIPDDAVGMNPLGELPTKRVIYLKATNYYRDLANIQRISDDLYLQTRFDPKIEVAKAKKQELFQALGVNSIQEAYAQAVLAKKYLASIQEVYSAQLVNLNIQAIHATEFLEEYATIKSYNESTAGIDYAYLLNFIEESQEASSSLPVASFTATGDVVDVDLEMVDTYTTTKLLKQTLSFATYDNFSFDFSTGFFYNNLVEPEYYLNLTENENGRLYIQEENKSNTDISIGALGHFTYKFLPEWRGGIALGAAISPFDGNLRYLIGPSIIWGGQKQASLTFGLALAQMDELSGAVLSDDQGTYLLEDPGAVPTINKLQSGFFIGLTYNLTNRKQPQNQ
ncbi:MAG TPA: hypothetical protein ENH91_13805 [Leeuwenhoekiella sp.]|nr:hypothetical protein [Leeuwenhoekiella sp.]